MRQLIEDYKRRLKTIRIELNSIYGDQILDKVNYYGENVDFIKKVERLTTKANDYKTFIAELEHELTLSKKKEYYNKFPLT